MEQEEIFKMITAERERQDIKWGFPQKLNTLEWSGVLGEEAGELIKELNNLHSPYLNTVGKLHAIQEAVQVAAVAVSIIQHLTRTTKNNEVV